MSEDAKKNEASIEDETVTEEGGQLPEVPAADLDDLAGGFQVPGVKTAADDIGVCVEPGCVSVCWSKTTS